MKLSDTNLNKFGDTVQLVGGVWAGEGKAYVCLFPEETGNVFVGLDENGEHRSFLRQADDDPLDVEVLNMGPSDWERFLRQTDLMETEIIARSSDGTLTRAIARKSSRQIDQNVSWRMFKRDGYACRYCGKDDVPLTVDHLVRWEEGGPSTEANLLSACRKCNRTRGDQPYADWVKSRYYERISVSLPPSVREANASVAATLDAIPRKVHVTSR